MLLPEGGSKTILGSGAGRQAGRGRGRGRCRDRGSGRGRTHRIRHTSCSTWVGICAARDVNAYGTTGFGHQGHSNIAVARGGFKDHPGQRCRQSGRQAEAEAEAEADAEAAAEAEAETEAEHIEYVIRPAGHGWEYVPLEM